MSDYPSVRALVANATTDELATMAAIAQRAEAKPCVLVTLTDRRRYVVDQEDEASIRPLLQFKTREALAECVGYSNVYFGGQWLRGYGRVDEMYRSLSAREIVKVEEQPRARVWGR